MHRIAGFKSKKQLVCLSVDSYKVNDNMNLPKVFTSNWLPIYFQAVNFGVHWTVLGWTVFCLISQSYFHIDNYNTKIKTLQYILFLMSSDRC